MNETDKKWLIKSENMILGPYTKEEVEQLVSDSIISINDEITEPFTFWWGLRDHPEFKDFAQHVKMQTRITHLITGIGSRLSTLTGKTAKDQKTTTHTLTPSNAPVKDAVFQTVDTKKSMSDAGSVRKDFSEKAEFQAKLESRKVAAKKTQRIVKGFWLGIIVLSLSVLFYIAYNEFVLPSKRKQKAFVNVKYLGMQAYQTGDYTKAFEYLSEGLKENVLEDSEKVALASLLLRTQKAVKAHEILRRLPAELASSMEVLSLKGLWNLVDRNYELAEEFFLKAKTEEEKQEKGLPFRSLLNLTLLHYIKGDFPSAIELADQLTLSGYERGFLYYLKTLVRLAKGEDIESVSQDINTFVKIDPEYRQEFSVLLAWINREDKQKREDYIKKALNEDPYFISEYHYNLLIGNWLLDWKWLLPYCKGVFEKDPENPLLNSFYGFCHIKSQNRREAQRYLETARKQASDNPLVTSVLAYSLIEGGNLARAESLLDMIQEHGQTYPVLYVLKARIYALKEEWSLVILTLKDLLSVDSGHISGNGGLAYASFQTGNHRDYVIHRERALRMYPHYKTLLVLKKAKGKGRGFSK